MSRPFPSRSPAPVRRSFVGLAVIMAAGCLLESVAMAQEAAAIAPRAQVASRFQTPPRSQPAQSSYGWDQGQLITPTPAADRPWQTPNSVADTGQSRDWTAVAQRQGDQPDVTYTSTDANAVTPQVAYEASYCGSCSTGCRGARGWQVLPSGLIYQAYLAGEKESRLRSVWNHDEKDGWIWDITLGGRAAILRYGTFGDARPEGFEIDIEGAGQPRLDMDEDNDVDAADFRFGVPFTYGTRDYQVKFAYYHLSSHLGDEFLLKNVGFPRLNYSRDELVLGGSYYTCPELRFYAEAGWAFHSDVAEPWEFQFGFDYAPAGATGIHGAPFVAFNGHLREEVDFGGNLVFQAGWAWRRSPASGTFRAGLQYFNGQSEQFSFFARSENKVGIGLWYDF